MSKEIRPKKNLDGDQNLLLQVLRKPQLMGKLDTQGWNQVLFDAHILKLRARLAHDAETLGLWPELPDKVQQILTNAKIDTASRQRKIMWEMNRVGRALYDFKEKVILVKGAAYIARNLRCANGRDSVDLDILVAKKHLDIVENHLFMAGYGSQTLDDYDQQYYREWAHELPPLVHPSRLVEVDVHHTILQVTNKLSPKIDVMINSSQELNDQFHTLCAEDMLIHSIVHQFVDGSLKSSLRNLLEQHDMIGEFAGKPAFWTNFMDRAETLNLGRPVFYCLRYCVYFLNTPIPDDVMARAKGNAPGWIVLKLMDLMILRTMVPFGVSDGVKRSKWTDFLSTNGLYIRSHWLRMPPMMLFTHLLRKFFRRLFVRQS
ncbi:MAG: hypothetical protein COA93_12205 [Alphaproteobacteria bacterium]|nr:MAG: hypothetical protein COA93_12205 [Alphaproteobacteria bacterium]